MIDIIFLKFDAADKYSICTKLLCLDIIVVKIMIAYYVQQYNIVGGNHTFDMIYLKNICCTIQHIIVKIII